VAGFYGILLIIALVAVSGLIAYVGDILGRRLGRKRLSIFGLRPRHTAIAISVLAGMLITLFTLAVAMAVNQNVKDGFLNMERMRRQQRDLSRDVDGLDRRIGELAHTRGALEQQVKAGQAALAQSEQRRTDLQQTVADLDKRKAKLEKELERADRQVKQRERDVKQREEVLDRMYKTQILLQRSLDAAKATAAQAATEYALGRAIPVLFGAGQPLDVEVFAGGQPVAAAHRQLEAFVARITAKVTGAGARPAPGQKQAVVVTSSRPMRDPRTNEITFPKSHQVLNAVSERINEASGGVIVRAFSLFNTRAGEPVYVDFELFGNEHVFSRGAVLTEKVIDGRRSEPDLMGALVSLLRDDVGARARARGVMPRIASSPGLFGSPGGAVGEMTYEELFQVIERLRQVNGPARVTAVAADDTWTIGPLKVDLRVEPVLAAALPR